MSSGNASEECYSTSWDYGKLSVMNAYRAATEEGLTKAHLSEFCNRISDGVNIPTCSSNVVKDCICVDDVLCKHSSAQKSKFRNAIRVHNNNDS